jgi:predicted aminopeptidase
MTVLRNILRSAAALAPLLMASCGTVRFYSQAVQGQREMLHRARPLAAVAADPASSEKLRRQLAVVAELREFARTGLHLPVTKQFGTYADLGRPYAVLNVYAAPEFSVEAVSWWYPFIGRAKYRGFFDEKLARQEAADLKRAGLDVVLSGVRVYSTLGWFADPVLNTFIGEAPAELAETLFHELTHARVFIRGDSDFNEAFATANAQEGVRRWLRAKGDATALAHYEQGLRRDEKLLDLLTRTRASLKDLYGKKGALSGDAMRLAKARALEAAREEYAAMKRRGEADSARDGWFGKQFNNARLASIATYHDLVPGFEQMLRDNGGDVERFYESVAAMKHLGKAERRERLQPLRTQVSSPAPPRS